MFINNWKKRKPTYSCAKKGLLPQQLTVVFLCEAEFSFFITVTTVLKKSLKQDLLVKVQHQSSKARRDAVIKGSSETNEKQIKKHNNALNLLLLGYFLTLYRKQFVPLSTSLWVQQSIFSRESLYVNYLGRIFLLSSV